MLSTHRLLPRLQGCVATYLESADREGHRDSGKSADLRHLRTLGRENPGRWATGRDRPILLKNSIAGKAFPARFEEGTAFGIAVFGFLFGSKRLGGSKRDSWWRWA